MASGGTNPYSLSSITGGAGSAPSGASKASTSSNPFSLASIVGGAPRSSKGGIFGLPGISTITQLGAGALSTAANILNQPQQVITHLMTGDVAGAGKAAGRFAAAGINPLSPLGVKLPGQEKYLGSSDDPANKISFTQALAKDGFKGLQNLKAGPVGPIARFAAEAATDPLSYVTLGASAPAKAALKEVADAGGTALAKSVAEKGVAKLSADEAAQFTEALGERAAPLADTLRKPVGGVGIGIPGGPHATLPGTQGTGTAIKEAAGRGIQRLATGTADLAGGALGGRAPRLASALDTAAMGAQEHVVQPLLGTVERGQRLFSNTARVAGALKDAGVPEDTATAASDLFRKAEQSAVGEAGTKISRVVSDLRGALVADGKPAEADLAHFLITGGKAGLEGFPNVARALAPAIKGTGSFDTALSGISGRLASAGTREGAAQAIIKPAMVEQLSREIVPMLREQGVPEEVLTQLTERGPTKVIPSAPELKTTLTRLVSPESSTLPGLKSVAPEAAQSETSAALSAALRNPEIATAIRQSTGRGTTLAGQLTAALTKDGVTRPEQFAEVGQYLLGRGGLENAPAVRAVLDRMPSAVGAARVGQDALGPVPDAVVKALAEAKTPMDAALTLAVRGAQRDAERSLEHTLLNSGFDTKTVGALKGEIRKVTQTFANEDMNKFLKGFEKATAMWRRGAIQSPGFQAKFLVGHIWNNTLRGVGVGAWADASKDMLTIREALGNAAFREDVGALGKEAALAKHLSPESLKNLTEAEKLGVFSSNMFKTDTGRAGLLGGVEAAKTHPIQSLLRPMQVFGSDALDLSRYANYLQGIKDGLSPEGATAMVKRYLFDYQDLTPFERHVMRNLVPFYTFMRHNTPMQFAEILQQPGKFVTLMHFRQNVDTGGKLPETGAEAAFKASQPLSSALQGHYKESARGLLAMPGGVAGLPRVALENSLGVSNFTGRPMNPAGQTRNLISGLSPAVGNIIKLATGTTPQKVKLLTGITLPTSANTPGGAAKPKASTSKPKIKSVPKAKKAKLPKGLGLRRPASKSGRPPRPSKAPSQRNLGLRRH